MRIGVLAVQGGVEPHIEALRQLGHEAARLRSAADFTDLDGLVLPGGESTTQQRIIDRLGLRDPLEAVFARRLPILATCAGTILARDFGWLNVELVRNGWGSQLASFEALDDSGTLAMTFIRAPRITAMGPDVEPLATLNGEVVLVQHGSLVAATFHPELADGRHTVHELVFGGVVHTELSTDCGERGERNSNLGARRAGHRAV